MSISILAPLMPVSLSLSALGRLFRRPPPPPDELLEAYAHEVIPVLDRAEWLYQYWLEQSTLFSDSEKLGNVAAIHRWETASMGRSLGKVIPPAALADAHASVIEALEMASRAAQLLSSGSRFHNANAVCEGQDMLGASRARRLAALRSMRRYLGRLQEAATDPAELMAGDTPATASPEAAAVSDPATVVGNTTALPTAPVEGGGVDLAETAPVQPAAPPVSPPDLASVDGTPAPAQPDAVPPQPNTEHAAGQAADADAWSDGSEAQQATHSGWGALFGPRPPGPPDPPAPRS